GARPATERGAQDFLFARIIGPVGRFAESRDFMSVGFDNRRIHPIERGARHRSECPNGTLTLDGLIHGLFLCLTAAYTLPRISKPRQAMTYHPKSDFMRILIERGFLADCTDYQGLDDALISGPQTAYIGYDATAKSLHVGHLLNIMLLRWFQTCGHKPITLMGGGTTKVGDPSFRSDERPLLNEAAIDDNIAGMQKVFARYLSYDDADGARMLNNAEWLDDLNYLEFLRDIGRHFSVNRMLSFESVKSRLDREQSLSFLEFNYMILQAYDFLELNRRQDCILQMGGSDQWGNIIN
ncbi:unnamed protein product, partial [Ectocarpus sp. 12 AP-2014]